MHQVYNFVHTRQQNIRLVLFVDFLFFFFLLLPSNVQEHLYNPEVGSASFEHHIMHTVASVHKHRQVLVVLVIAYVYSSVFFLGRVQQKRRL